MVRGFAAILSIDEITGFWPVNRKVGGEQWQPGCETVQNCQSNPAGQHENVSHAQCERFLTAELLPEIVNPWICAGHLFYPGSIRAGSDNQ